MYLFIYLNQTLKEARNKLKKGGRGRVGNYYEKQQITFPDFVFIDVYEYVKR